MSDAPNPAAEDAVAALAKLRGDLRTLRENYCVSTIADDEKARREMGELRRSNHVAIGALHRARHVLLLCLFEAPALDLDRDIKAIENAIALAEGAR